MARSYHDCTRILRGKCFLLKSAPLFPRRKRTGIQKKKEANTCPQCPDTAPEPPPSPLVYNLELHSAVPVHTTHPLCFSSWTSWGLSSPGLNLAPREPPVSLRTLTFCWDSSPEDDEGEEEEEEEGWRESESEDSGAGSWGAKSLQRTEVRPLGHYLAR